MADITWPSSGRAFAPEAYDEGLEHDVQITVARSGRITTRSLPGARWKVSLKFPQESVAWLAQRRQLEGFLSSLRGGADRLLLWNLLTPAPLGTLRGSPVLSASAAIGARAVSISGGTGTTVLRGDRVSIGGQRVIATADATRDGGTGIISLAFEPALRAAAGAATPVVWDKPVSKFVPASPLPVFPSRQDKLPGFGIELVEAWD